MSKTKRGRPEGSGKLARHEAEIVQLTQLGVPHTAIAKRYNVHRMTVGHFVKRLRAEGKL